MPVRVHRDVAEDVEEGLPLWLPDLTVLLQLLLYLLRRQDALYELCLETSSPCVQLPLGAAGDQRLRVLLHSASETLAH